MCPDCYDYTGHVLFNALAPELWRRFVIYLPRQLARLTGITQRQLAHEVRVRFVKVAEYQHRGVIHYHAVIRLDAAGDSHHAPPPRYTTGSWNRRSPPQRPRSATTPPPAPAVTYHCAASCRSARRLTSAPLTTRPARAADRLGRFWSLARRVSSS
jgi:hypothetical protein